MYHRVGYNENVLNGSGCREVHGGSKWESAARVFKKVGGAEVPFYPVETVRRVELGPASVTKITMTVRGDPKGCWMLEPGLRIVDFACQVR